MLYACYDLIRPDVIMEISWRKGLHDFTMPFMINFLCEQTRTIEMLKKDNEERKSREKSQRTEEDNTPILGGSRLMLTQGPAAAPASPMPYGQPANGITPQATGFRPF
jgi:clathrin heavy chain